jgi:hypothetical protein
VEQMAVEVTDTVKWWAYDLRVSYTEAWILCKYVLSWIIWF